MNLKTPFIFNWQINLENSITFDNESLNQKWYSLVQVHGGVQSCVELLRHRKLYINELILMEAIRSISCSISENSVENHFIDKPTDLPYTSTQNVQNTNIAISLFNKCAEKPQGEAITKLDAPLSSQKNKNRTNQVCRRFYSK